MIQYPIEFKCNASTKNGINTPWTSLASQHSSALSIPPEFEGPGGALSPEDLFSQALTNCFIATFKVYAEMSKLTFDEVTAESVLIVDKNEAKQPIMKSIAIKIEIIKPSNESRALSLAEKAAKSGFILNSVKTECLFTFQVR
ncbi:MAG: OsmC family protein [Proteobacteria bacterium]|nr:OsmC family protein [Pseudomonadota bacterium]